MKKFAGIAVIFSLFTTGCVGEPASPQTSLPPPKLVAVGDILNALKCELATTFHGQGFVRKLLKEDENHPGYSSVEGTLTLSNAIAKGSSGEGGLEVQAFGASFGGSGSTARTTTRSNEVAFDFSFAANDTMGVPAFCNDMANKVNGPIVRIEGHPFIAILNGISAEYEKVKSADPKVKFGPLSFTSNFEIENTKEAGVEIALLIFKFGSKRTSAITESQSLELKFDIDKLPATSPM